MMTVLAATRPCHQGKTLSGPHAVAPPYIQNATVQPKGDVYKV